MNLNLRQHLKFTARGFLAHAKPSPMLIGIAALAIMTMLDFLGSKITNEAARNEAILKAAQQAMETQNIEHYMDIVSKYQPTFMQNILSALLSLMVLMIATGIVIYVICECRWHKGSFGNLFDALPILLRVFWYQFITTALTLLWGLLFIIPGLIDRCQLTAAAGDGLAEGILLFQVDIDLPGAGEYSHPVAGC